MPETVKENNKNGGAEMLPPPPPSNVSAEASESDPCMDYKDKKRRRRGAEWWRETEGMLVARTGLHRKALYCAMGLVGALLVLVVVVVAMGATWPRTPHRYLFPACEEPACLRAAAQIRDSLNTTHSPCNNLWQFACGGWLSKHTLPPGKSMWNQRQQLMREEAIRIREMITTLPLPLHTGTIEWKMKHLYDACMEVDIVNADQARPLANIISQLGGWYILRDWNEADFDANFLLRELHVKYGATPYFEVSVQPNPPFPGHSSITISPAGLGLPDRRYYYGTQDDPIQQAYKQQIRDAVIYLSGTKTEAERFGNDMFYYEKRIAEVMPDGVELTNPINTNNFIKVSELKETVQTLPLQDILMAMYPNANVTEETEVIVTSMDYLTKVARIVATTDRTTMNSYIMWTLVHKYLPYLSSQYVSVVNSLEKELFGIENPSPRWEMCVSLVEKFMGTATEAILSKQNPLENNTISLVHEMFVNIKKAAGKRVEKLKKMPDLYMHLKKKIKNLSLQIGLPDTIKESNYLTAMYRMLIVQKANLFDSYRNGLNFLRKMEETRLKLPEIEDYLVAKAGDVVSYSPAADVVVVPRVLLTKPAFESAFPSPILYGRLGVDIANAVIASIMPFESAWTSDKKLLSPFHIVVNESIWAIQPAERCLKKFVVEEQMCFSGVEDSVVLSLVKELAALSVAQEAFEATLKEENHTHQPTLETYEDSALFFLTYAQTQCSLTSKQRDMYENFVNFKITQKHSLKAAFEHVLKFRSSLECSGVSQAKCDGIF